VFMFAAWVCWVIEEGMEGLKARGNKGRRHCRRGGEREKEGIKIRRERERGERERGKRERKGEIERGEM
jgi:hypothetical protein